MLNLNMLLLMFFIGSSMTAFMFCIPVPVQLLNDPDEVLVESVRPYDFGYEIGDGLGMSQYRSETSDGNGLVQGSYGYVDPDGLYRSVEYKANSDGYQAIVKSNEPGLANQNSANATFIVESPPPDIVLGKDVPRTLVEFVKAA